MPALETLDRIESATVSPSAVVWIDESHAVVATVSRNGWYSTCEIARGLEPELSYLALVVHTIGDRKRVMVMGPNSVRLALEREYVTMFHLPERLVDTESDGVLDGADLIVRLRALAA